MKEVNEIKTKLIEFRDCDKFKIYGYLQPGLGDSTEEYKEYINKEMSLCSNKLLDYLEKNTQNENDLKKIVRNSLEKIEDSALDTEEREFCYELYFKIGEIIGVDVEDKGKSIEEKLMEDIQRMIKKTGLNPDDFIKK